jgi:hypothetical protein
MDYFVSLPLPAITPVTSPVSLRLPIHAGILDYIEIEFPTRCAGLAHVWITRAAQQIAPFNPGGSYTGDGRIIHVDLNLPITDDPYDIVIWGYNLDDTFMHTPTVQVNVKEKNPGSMAAALLNQP